MKKEYVLGLGLLFAAGISQAGCGDDESAFECDESGPGRCLGKFVEKEGKLEADGSLTYEFTLEEGPTCVSGSAFRSFYRGAKGESDTLLLFLPSDGAWLPTSSPLMTSGRRTPATLALAPAHPLFAEANEYIGDHHLVYVSACDGSLYAGDRDFSTEELQALGVRDTEPRYYRGAQNVSAGIDIALQHVQSPSRVIVGGSGAGSMGAIMAVFAVAKAYPDADIVLLQNGTTGIIFGEEDPAFMRNLFDLWGIMRNMPADCVGCEDNGHLTVYIRHALQTIPKLRVGTYQATREGTLPLFISNVPNQTPLDPERWRCEIMNEVKKLRDEFPDRYGAFIVDNSATTFESLSGGASFELNGVNIVDWVNSIVDKDAAPITVTESDLEAPEDCPAP